MPEIMKMTRHLLPVTFLAAVRQARARGIAAVMETLAKDELFTRMLLSEYPLAVSVDSLVVDGDAVNLTEGPYEGAAVGLLERSERLLQQADAATRRGADRESQLSAQDAYGAYSEAQSALEEVRVILAPLGDNSVFTRSGSNLAALRTRLDALETSVAGGLARIERIEQDLEAEQGVRQSVETLRALEERVDAATLVETAPFPNGERAGRPERERNEPWNKPTRKTSLPGHSRSVPMR